MDRDTYYKSRHARRERLHRYLQLRDDYSRSAPLWQAQERAWRDAGMDECLAPGLPPRDTHTLSLATAQRRRREKLVARLAWCRAHGIDPNPEYHPWWFRRCEVTPRPLPDRKVT